MASAVLVDDAPPSKPWMVMVHGMSQDHRVFSRQVEAFRSRFRILLVDLPGHGLSSALGGPFGHVEFADHVHITLASSCVENAHYWGTHTGATVGLFLAAISPGLFRSLTLEGPVIPGDNPPVVVEAFERAKSIARREGVDMAIKGWWESCWFDYMRANPEKCRAQEHFDIVREFGGRPWIEDHIAAPITEIEVLLARITVPTLIYNGTMDHPNFVSVARRLKDLLPDVTQISVEETGGFPAWENPDLTNKVVVDFVSAI